jgi:hypothetical protein
MIAARAEGQSVTVDVEYFSTKTFFSVFLPIAMHTL